MNESVATERDARVLSVARDVCVAERVTVDGPSEPLSAPAPAASAVLVGGAAAAHVRRERRLPQVGLLELVRPQVPFGADVA